MAEQTPQTETAAPHTLTWRRPLPPCQLPTLTQTAGSEQGIGELLQQMGVKDGEGISFKHFWSLIQSLATSQHDMLSSIKTQKCGCALL
ncbi:hypothetical protein AAFF_G00169740 [Aldrovandia affinis]|uniref:S100/CaBP-9k-type calcium binding subdomain domain-containing protein n=1 Tax=Aldrovandia affinis TaxID=143900 RepID=A0AAD7W886_9TELE|nr:hypothetical protein AAFF_G00169740 [Aldrovandia affinis]